VIYTVLSGKYDVLKPVECVEEGVDYICITDTSTNVDVPTPWEKLVVDANFKSGQKFNRYYKINHNELFRYELSLYVDSNIEIKRPVKQYIFDALKEHDIALYEHELRNDIYEEANECINLGLDYAKIINRQVKKYKRSGFSDNILYENNIIFRRNSKKISELCDNWWQEYLMHSRRDQLSLTYCSWKGEVKIKSLGKKSETSQPYFYLNHHNPSKRKKIKNIARRIINKLYA
jgi:DNA replicative helicase MCM subunit Mcm2 (Cdc46/Mcm family)